MHLNTSDRLDQKKSKVLKGHIYFELLTKGTKKLVKVTGFPFFGECHMENMITFRLYYKTNF